MTTNMVRGAVKNGEDYILHMKGGMKDGVCGITWI
jgi:hypothetical protein